MTQPNLQPSAQSSLKLPPAPFEVIKLDYPSHNVLHGFRINYKTLFDNSRAEQVLSGNTHGILFVSAAGEITFKSFLNQNSYSSKIRLTDINVIAGGLVLQDQGQNILITAVGKPAIRGKSIELQIQKLNESGQLEGETESISDSKLSFGFNGISRENIDGAVNVKRIGRRSFLLHDTCNCYVIDLSEDMKSVLKTTTLSSEIRYIPIRSIQSEQIIAATFSEIVQIYKTEEGDWKVKSICNIPQEQYFGFAANGTQNFAMVSESSEKSTLFFLHLENLEYKSYVTFNVKSLKDLGTYSVCLTELTEGKHEIAYCAHNMDESHVRLIRYSENKAKFLMVPEFPEKITRIVKDDSIPQTYLAFGTENCYRFSTKDIF